MGILMPKKEAVNGIRRYCLSANTGINLVTFLCIRMQRAQLDQNQAYGLDDDSMLRARRF